jgi:hypothetical protein
LRARISGTVTFFEDALDPYMLDLGSRPVKLRSRAPVHA